MCFLAVLEAGSLGSGCFHGEVLQDDGARGLVFTHSCVTPPPCVPGTVLNLPPLAPHPAGLSSPSPVTLHPCPQWGDPGHVCWGRGMLAVCIRAKQWPSQHQAGSTWTHSGGTLAAV
ncbi:unnamed protein product [Rangifer tarandus platyrhynchus]|uniref:Uncharacterized protein n=2 Tax=Rangifer tarandus platyrhynchus TaxID=3082113 RepID=A0ABN8ZEC1_RANTA|nr:unnamed protein product [Rangifer tarandus platyrhynchus]